MIIPNSYCSYSHKSTVMFKQYQLVLHWLFFVIAV